MQYGGKCLIFQDDVRNIREAQGLITESPELSETSLQEHPFLSIAEADNCNKVVYLDLIFFIPKF